MSIDCFLAHASQSRMSPAKSAPPARTSLGFVRLKRYESLLENRPVPSPTPKAHHGARP
jgi:hypothetical protein